MVIHDRSLTTDCCNASCSIFKRNPPFRVHRFVQIQWLVSTGGAPKQRDRGFFSRIRYTPLMSSWVTCTMFLYSVKLPGCWRNLYLRSFQVYIVGNPASPYCRLSCTARYLVLSGCSNPHIARYPLITGYPKACEMPLSRRCRGPKVGALVTTQERRPNVSE